MENGEISLPGFTGDWQTKPLEEIAEIRSGGTPSTTKSELWDGEIPWCTPTDITALNGRKYLTETARTITPAGLRSSSAELIVPNSIIMTSRATIGECAINIIPVTTNQGFKNLIPFGADPEFLYYLMTTQKQRLIQLCGGSTFLEVGKKQLRQFELTMPVLVNEQRAIASVLSDVDALLEELDRLIAKKRALKQAAMQQLLTGKKRIKGFNHEWTLRRLGDHVIFLSHGTNSRAELRADSPVKYLHYGDIHASVLSILDPSSLPSLPEEKAKGLDRLRDGDLVFADASEDLTGVSKSVEICGVESTELVAGLHTIPARFDKDVLADGFKAYLQFCPVFASQLRRLAAGTKVYATNRSHIASIEMRLPNIEEQTAIANVLSDMDAEIEALEERRAKTALLKEGMMQELLTGKTRLVIENGESKAEKTNVVQEVET